MEFKTNKCLDSGATNFLFFISFVFYCMKIINYDIQILSQIISLEVPKIRTVPITIAVPTSSAVPKIRTIPVTIAIPTSSAVPKIHTIPIIIAVPTSSAVPRTLTVHITIVVPTSLRISSSFAVHSLAVPISQSIPSALAGLELL